MKNFIVFEGSYGDTMLYYVGINSDSHSLSDRYIANFLDIRYNEYINLMISYGANAHFMGYIFYNKEDGQKFADHLNNKYLVMMKLLGKI